MTDLERHLLIRLHWVEHVVFVLASHMVSDVLFLVVVKDSTIVVLLVVVSLCLLLAARRNDLDITVVRQEFHVWRAIKKHFAGNRRQRVSQTAQLVLTMSEAAVVLELADTGLLIVTADLRLVVRVNSPNVVAARVVRWHRLNKI